jgi:hypothetical protein
VGVAGVRIGHGAAGGVVVVAELLVAEAGAAAAAAVGEDVAALVAFRFFVGFVWHVVSPLGTFGPKVFKLKGLPLDFTVDPG